MRPRRQEPFPSDPTYPTAIYCYLQGTSMASPHVAGVGALIVSRYGRASNPENGKLSPGRRAAQPDRRPAGLPVHAPARLLRHHRRQQRCYPELPGRPGYNSSYGDGQVDAFNAVTH